MARMMFSPNAQPICPCALKDDGQFSDRRECKQRPGMPWQQMRELQLNRQKSGINDAPISMMN
jgi:hypothetical protein